MTIVLKERLRAINVTVSVKTFEENEGIAGLGDDLFVSSTMVHVCQNLYQQCTHTPEACLATGTAFRKIKRRSKALLSL